MMDERRPAGQQRDILPRADVAGSPATLGLFGDVVPTDVWRRVSALDEELKTLRFGYGDLFNDIRRRHAPDALDASGAVVERVGVVIVGLSRLAPVTMSKRNEREAGGPAEVLPDAPVGSSTAVLLVGLQGLEESIYAASASLDGISDSEVSNTERVECEEAVRDVLIEAEEKITALRLLVARAGLAA